MKILFITSTWIGDAVLSTGVLGHLVDSYPDARFTVVCGVPCADLFRAVPRLDRLITLRKQKYNKHWLGLWRDLYPTKWDMIVDLRNTLVARALRKKRYLHHGKSSGKHKLVDNAAIVGMTTPPPLKIYIDDKAMAVAGKMPSPDLILSPTANWMPKEWPIEKFAEITRRLIAPDGLLAGGNVAIMAHERDRARIKPLMDIIPPKQRIELFAQDLLAIAALMQRGRLFIGNDSGMMHLASAIPMPTLGLFGPGWPEIYGPYGQNCVAVQTPEKRDPLIERFEKEKIKNPNFNLMQSLDVETVYHAACDLIKTTRQ